MDQSQEHPEAGNSSDWSRYWTDRGQAWRTDPEIEVTRMQELEARRQVKADVRKSTYPFKGMVLERADVEWLLATHEAGNGPIDREASDHAERRGLDIRGAELRDVDLSGLPLAYLHGAPDKAEELDLMLGAGPGIDDPNARIRFVGNVNLSGAHLEGAELAGVDFPRETNLEEAHLESARLDHACLEEASLRKANLRSASLYETNLTKANCAQATLELAQLPGACLEGTICIEACLRGARMNAIKAAGVHFTGASLDGSDLSVATLRNARMSGACLDRTDLSGARLQKAHLDHASLRDANLDGACLHDADLTRAHLEGAKLRADFGGSPEHHPARLEGCFFDASTELDGAHFGSDEYGTAFLADVRWQDVNLAVVPWPKVGKVGEERLADRGPGDRVNQLRLLEIAIRTNRQLSVVLRSQGLNEIAGEFTFRARVLQRRRHWLLVRRPVGGAGIVVRKVVRGKERRIWRIEARQLVQKVGRRVSLSVPHFLAWMASWLLNCLSGYGYRLRRTIVAYVFVIIAFAIGYQVSSGSAESPDWRGSLVMSVLSFHGRGFASGGASLEAPVSLIAAGEAIVGLVLEIAFIATFTERLFKD